MTPTLKTSILEELAPVVIALALSVSAAAAQSSVPTLNLSATCKPLDRNDFSMQIDTDRCLKSEHEARQKLAGEWTQHSAADRSLCTQTARMAGFESYVQLLTCLELTQDARKEQARADPRFSMDQPAAPMRERPAGLPQKQ
jgi:hypothetical protein